MKEKTTVTCGVCGLHGPIEFMVQADDDFYVCPVCMSLALGDDDRHKHGAKAVTGRVKTRQTQRKACSNFAQGYSGNRVVSLLRDTTDE